MKKTLLIFLLFLTGCTISINEQKAEVIVQREDYMQEYLEEYISVIKDLSEEFRYIETGSISFELVDGVFHIGAGKIFGGNEKDILVVISGCKNKQNEIQYCTGSGNIPEKEELPFYNHNYVKLGKEKDFDAYYFGIVEGKIETIKYNGNDLETTVGEVELNGEMKKYTLWFYKTDIEEQFDGELLTY